MLEYNMRLIRVCGYYPGLVVKHPIKKLDHLRTGHGVCILKMNQYRGQWCSKLACVYLCFCVCGVNI